MLLRNQGIQCRGDEGLNDLPRGLIVAGGDGGEAVGEEGIVAGFEGILKAIGLGLKVLTEGIVGQLAQQQVALPKGNLDFVGAGVALGGVGGA